MEGHEELLEDLGLPVNFGPENLHQYLCANAANMFLACTAADLTSEFDLCRRDSLDVFDVLE